LDDIPRLDEVQEDRDECGEDETVEAAILVAEGMHQLEAAGRLPAQPRRLDSRSARPRPAHPCRGKCCASNDDIDEKVEEKGGQQRQSKQSRRFCQEEFIVDRLVNHNHLENK